jgi:hypothetical protein
LLGIDGDCVGPGYGFGSGLAYATGGGGVAKGLWALGGKALKRQAAVYGTAAATKMGARQYARRHSGRLLNARAQGLSNAVSGRTAERAASVIRKFMDFIG